MAGKGLGTLTLDLVTRIGGFERGLDKAARTADKRMREIERRAKTFGIALGASLVAGVTAAGYAIKAAIDQADQLNEISQKVGIPTDVLSGLNYAAKLAGVATEELQGGLVKLTKFQADAAQGGKDSTRVFETLGIAVKDAGGNLRNTSDLFNDFADIFSKLEDGPAKTALALQVFGKAGAELIPLLNEGREGLAGYADELKSLGGVVTPQVAAQADAFNDELDKIRVTFGGLALQIAAQLLPEMTKLAKEFRLFVQSGAAKSVGDEIADGMDFAAKSIRRTSFEIQELRKAWNEQGLFGEGIFSVLSRAQKMAEDQAKAAQQISSGGYAGGNARGRGVQTGRLAGIGDKSVADAARRAASLYTPEDKPGKKAGKSDAERAAEQLAAAYERMNAQMREQITLFGQTSEVSKVRYDLENGELAKLDPAQKAVLLNQAKMLDSLKADKELLDERNKAEEERLKLAQDAKDSLAATLEDMQFELDLMGKTNAERITAIELRRIGIGLSKEEAEAAAISIKAHADQLEATRQQVDALDDFRASFADNVASVLDGSKSISDAIKSIADNFIAQVARMLAQKWTEQLFGQFGTTGTGSSGGILSLFSSFLGGARAEGGPVMAGVPYLVGEKGPEIVVPKSAGTVVPNSSLKASGGSRQLNVTVNPPAGMSRQSASQFAIDVGRQIQRQTARTD